LRVVEPGRTLASDCQRCQFPEIRGDFAQ